MRSYGQYCSVAKALDVVGDRWTLLIVRELLLQGPCRYTDLKNGLPGIATNLLSDRLRELEAAGLVRREEAAPPVATTLFHLTEAGAGSSRSWTPSAAGGSGTWPSRTTATSSAATGSPSPSRSSSTTAIPAAPRSRSSSAPAGPRSSRSPAARSAPGSARRRPRTWFSTGAPRLILGLLSAHLTPAQAQDLGLTITGDPAVLRRIRPLPADPAAPGLIPNERV